ncbi:hypothetical protein ACWCRF_21530 [Streptomyces sp. NPDC002405]
MMAELPQFDSPPLRAWAAREWERAIAMYAKPPQAVPDRLHLAHPPTRTLTRKQQAEVHAAIKRIQRHKSKSKSVGLTQVNRAWGLDERGTRRQKRTR